MLFFCTLCFVTLNILYHVVYQYPFFVALAVHAVFMFPVFCCFKGAVSCCVPCTANANSVVLKKIYIHI